MDLIEWGMLTFHLDLQRVLQNVWNPYFLDFLSFFSSLSDHLSWKDLHSLGPFIHKVQTHWDLSGSGRIRWLVFNFYFRRVILSFSSHGGKTGLAFFMMACPSLFSSKFFYCGTYGICTSVLTYSLPSMSKELVVE